MSNFSITRASLLSPLLSGATGRATLAGAGGGLLSFLVGERVFDFAGNGGASLGVLEVLLLSALWSGAIGVALGAVILIYDNTQSLRGQWHRDALRALPLFFALSFLGGAAGQLAYSVVQNSLTRGIGWALMGAGVGVGIGLLRRDAKQAWRGALGGGIGGFLGGLAFNGLAMISSAGDGAFSRFFGQITMGALIGLLMRVVQEALKDAYLLGVSTGPYEGKQYPLNTARVSVGRAPSNDISLFREEIGPLQLGALLFENGAWNWQGEAVEINGTSHSRAPLAPGDTLQLGATRFRFYTRAGNSAGNSAAPVSIPVSNIAPHAPSGALDSSEKTTPAPPNPFPTGAATSARGANFALQLPDGQLLRIPNSSGPVSVGRTAQNSLILSDESVSSRHATLRVTGGQLAVCDLDSTNGTFVNGLKIGSQAPQTLQLGDRVRFGGLETTISTL